MDGIAVKYLGVLVLLFALTSQHQSHGRKALESRKNVHRRAAMNRQKRDWIIDTFTLEEELPDPYPKLVGTVRLEEDFKLIYKLQGKGVDEDPKGLFHINEDNGSIYVHQKIDFETTPLFQWKFNAINRTSMKVGTRLGIHLKILDINDNAPEFKNKTYYVTVNESAVQGYTIYTMLAYDKDDENSPNSVVSYFLLSQIPSDPNVEFTIDKDKGFISFRGCLSYETNKYYKLLIEARDNGVKVQQSSTCEVHVTVLDRNTYSPTWSATSLSTSVPERDSNVSIFRLAVVDTDTPFTSAWRAVYTIVDGDDEGHFKMLTDPKTNEGILNVVKPLDYEESTKRQLSIVVGNEEPLYSCKVLKKSLNGLWTLDVKIQNGKSMETETITVNVIDVNDAPIFKPESILVTLDEHYIKPGNVLTTVKATDPDIVAPNKIKYIIENDTADWLTINEDTGVITTKKELDRESEYVKKSKYIVNILAVDDGVPAMTGIAKLIINLKDINDNVPRLESPYLSTCQNEEEALLFTSVADKDLEPYSGPFYVEVLGTEKEKKHVKIIDYSVSDNILTIKKEKEAFQGNHTLHLEIYDRQGVVSYENLTVYVCDCLGGEVCVEKMSDPPSLSGGAIVLLLLAPLLFLLLCFLLCKIQTKKVMVPMENEPLNSIIAYNEEGGNKDCQASAILSGIGNMGDFANANQEEIDGTFHRSSTKMYSAAAAVVGSHNSRVYRSNSMQVKPSMNHASNRGAVGSFDRSNRRRHSSYHGGRRQNTINKHSVNTGRHNSFATGNNSLYRKDSRTLEAALIQKLTVQMNDLEIYKPQVFADEGKSSRASSLEAISITGSNDYIPGLQSFGSKFNILENICADHMTNLPETQLS